MAVAAKKINELIDQFIAILSEGRTFQGSEEFGFRKELCNFPEGQLEGDQLRAFFYACSGNMPNAISYFKTSLGYNEPDFMENYLIYLMNNGFVKLYISETIRVNNQLSDNPKLLIQLARAYLLSGDFDGMVNVRNNLTKLGNGFTLFLDREIDELNTFQRNVDLNDEQMKFLINTYVDIVDKHKVDAVNIHFEYFEEGDEAFNSIILYTRCDDVNLLVDMEFELAKTIAKNPAFIGKRFAPSFEYFEYPKDNKDHDYVRKM